MTLVLGLAEAGVDLANLVGHKAARLAALARLGLPIPRGFCITSLAYREHLHREGLNARIAERFAQIEDPAELAAASRDARIWIRRQPLSATLRSAATRAYHALGGGPVAVRSSGLGEDLGGASFAGQYDSFLNLRGVEQVLQGILDCWASTWSERATSYRFHAGDRAGEAAMACLVQAMVPACSAGVVFTAHPVSGDRNLIVVNAVAGLGDALVSGLATADEYVLQRDTGAVVSSKTGGHGPATVDLDALRRMAVQVEELLSGPQDIEWAWDDGLQVLQARPITALDRVPVPLADARRPLAAFFERIREMAPGPATPLSSDVAVEGIAPLIGDSVVHHGLLSRRLVGAMDTGARIVTGRIYVVLPRLMCEAFGRSEAELLDAMETGVRPPRGDVRWRRLVELGRHAPFAVPRIIVGMLRLESMGRRACAALDELVSPYEREDMSRWSDERLLAMLELRPDAAFRTRTIEIPPANFLARGLSTPVYNALEHMVTRWAREPSGSTGALLSGLAGLNEVDCAEALWQLAEGARGRRDLREALAQGTEAAARVLDALPRDDDWRLAFEAFLETYGHRAILEVELAQPRWSEEPGYVLSVIAGYLGCGPEAAPGAVAMARRAERSDAERRILARLGRRPLRRWVFRRVLRVAREIGPAGENTKFHIVRLLALLRRASLELGRRLAAVGSIVEQDDVFFLRRDELSNADRQDYRPRVASRRGDHARWSRIDAPRLIDADDRPVIEADAARVDATTLRGIGASPGRVRGRARIVLDPTRGSKLQPGEILVAPYTDPGWTPLFLTASAVVVEAGSLLSHASIVARELGVPSVVAVRGVTSTLPDGEWIEVDGTTGTVRRLPPDEAGG